VIGNRRNQKQDPNRPIFPQPSFDFFPVSLHS
jgi:hypothetical protein